MPIIPLKCPSCGAQLQADSDSAILTCKYCGTNSVMKDAIVQNYIQNTVNINAATVNVCSQKDFVIRGGVLEKYCGESVDVVIPSNVTAIGKEAFKGLQIRSVVIPNSVREIRDSAFDSCTALTSVKIPNSVTKIGTSAFYKCTALKSIKIPSSVTDIGTAFGCCSALESVSLPEGIRHIPSFYNCSSLTSINIPSSAVDIGSFSGCRSLTSITIPNGVTKIYKEDFAGCAALKSITIPNSVTEIDYAAFRDCRSLSSLTIGKGVQKIGQNAFEGCTSLTSVTIPENVTVMFYGAFKGCTALNSVTFNGAVPGCFLAFEGCTSLTSVKFRNIERNIKSDNSIILIDHTVEKFLFEKRKREGKCQHCGGSFKGIFKSVCSSCGREKDY